MTHYGKSTLRPAPHCPDSGLAQGVDRTSTALATSHSFSSRSQEAEQKCPDSPCLSCHSPQGAPALFQTELGARHAHRKIFSMFCVPFRSKRWRCRAAPNQLASRAASSPAGVDSSSPDPGRSQNPSSSLSPSLPPPSPARGPCHHQPRAFFLLGKFPFGTVSCPVRRFNQDLMHLAKGSW